MSQCQNIKNIDVRHKRSNRGNDLDNAEVLCQACYEKTAMYKQSKYVTEPFPNNIKAVAMALAKNKCQCTRVGCGWH